MKTLFENLLFNHRFVFQDTPKPQPTEAEGKKVEKTETDEFDQLLKDVEQRDKALSAVRKVVDKTEEAGKGETNKAQKDVAALDIDKYLKPLGSEGRPIRMEEVAFQASKEATEAGKQYVARQKGEAIPLGEMKISAPEAHAEGVRYQKLLAKITTQLDSVASDPKAFFEAYVKLSDKAKGRPLLRDALAEYKANNKEMVRDNLLARLNATEKGPKLRMYTAEEVYGKEGAATEKVASASKVEEVEKAAEKILTPEQELGEKTIAALNKYAYKLDSIASNSSKQLIYNINSANRDMIDRGVSLEALTKFNTTLVTMINEFKNIKNNDEIIAHAQKITHETLAANLGKKYEDKFQYREWERKNG